jgi:hypothetical protein
MEKYGRARQATDDNIIQRKRTARSITKGTDTHSEYVILLRHGNNGKANEPQCYIYTYTVLFILVYTILGQQCRSKTHTHTHTQAV